MTEQSPGCVPSCVVDMVRAALIDAGIPITKEIHGHTVFVFQVLSGIGTAVVDVHADGRVVFCGERGDDEDEMEMIPAETAESRLAEILADFRRFLVEQAVVSRTRVAKKAPGVARRKAAKRAPTKKKRAQAKKTTKRRCRKSPT